MTGQDLYQDNMYIILAFSALSPLMPVSLDFPFFIGPWDVSNFYVWLTNFYVWLTNFYVWLTNFYVWLTNMYM
jgi:hypothetical protein